MVGIVTLFVQVASAERNLRDIGLYERLPLRAEVLAGTPPPMWADRDGAAYIGESLDLVATRPGWTSLFDGLDPTSALLRDSDALTDVLVAQRGWVEVGRESSWVLLRPPGANGWPSG